MFLSVLYEDNKIVMAKTLYDSLTHDPGIVGNKIKLFKHGKSGQ